jgi:hypothetical protein
LSFVRAPHVTLVALYARLDRDQYNTFGPTTHLSTVFVTGSKVVYHKVSLAAMLLGVHETAEATVEFFGLQSAFLQSNS